LSFIQGLHGVVAIVLLCTLLFAEEAGVPLPWPGELTLLAAGLLIATGALDPWLFVPLAIAVCLAGSLTGYSWARLLGETGLKSAAERFHQTKRLDKVTARLQNAAPLQISISRLVPGLRVYTSLVAGAVGVNRQRFLLGVAPAVVLWVIVLVTLGVVVGVPAERFLGELESLVLQGGTLIVVGVGGYVAIRRIPEGGRAGLARLPSNLRSVLALSVDMAVIAAVVAGVLAIVRPVLRVGALAGWLDILVVMAVIAVFYSIATRRGMRATAGEALLGTHYLTQSPRDALRASLRRILRTALSQDPQGTSPDVGRAAEAFRALGDRSRLQVARLLLAGDHSLMDVSRELQLPPVEAALALQELQVAGLVTWHQTSGDRRYEIADDHVRLGLAEFLTTTFVDRPQR
jgi:membrane protein DedA with SNARE-associated domain